MVGYKDFEYIDVSECVCVCVCVCMREREAELNEILHVERHARFQAYGKC